MFYKVLNNVFCNGQSLVKNSTVKLDAETANALGAEYLEKVDAPEEDNSNAVENAADKQVKTSKKK